MLPVESSNYFTQECTNYLCMYMCLCQTESGDEGFFSLRLGKLLPGRHARAHVAITDRGDVHVPAKHVSKQTNNKSCTSVWSRRTEPRADISMAPFFWGVQKRTPKILGRLPYKRWKIETWLELTKKYNGGSFPRRKER